MTTFLCTLTGSQRYLRRRQWEALSTQVMGSDRPTAAVGTIAFADAPGVEAALDHLITLEAGCCPFLRMSRYREAGYLVLRIEAPGGEAVIDSIQEALSRPHAQ